MTSDRDLSVIYNISSACFEASFEVCKHSSNVVFKEFVLSSSIASPLIKPLFTPGRWHEVKWVY